MSRTLSHRGRVAALSRSRASDDPDLIAARRDLAADHLGELIARTLETAPPLTLEQRAKLSQLLLIGSSGAA